VIGKEVIGKVDSDDEGQDVRRQTSFLEPEPEIVAELATADGIVCVD